MFLRAARRLCNANVAEGVRSKSLNYPDVPAQFKGKYVFPKMDTNPAIALPDKMYFTFLAAGIAGVLLGNNFYLTFLLPKNPPHPRRDPNEPRPERHPHTVDEDED